MVTLTVLPESASLTVTLAKGVVVALSLTVPAVVKVPEKVGAVLDDTTALAQTFGGDVSEN